MLKFLLIITTVGMTWVKCEQYELPPYTSLSDQSVRLGQIVELKQPDIVLDKIYRRQVYQVLKVPQESNSSMIAEPQQCKQTPPQVSFKNIGYYHLDKISNSYQQAQIVTNSTEPPRKSNSIIYDYEALKRKQQNIVDMVYQDSHIFTISSSGMISMYKVIGDAGNGIQLRATVKGIDWDNLYEKRLTTWKHDEEDEKNRLQLIEKLKKQEQEEEKKKQLKEMQEKMQKERKEKEQKQNKNHTKKPSDKKENSTKEDKIITNSTVISNQTLSNKTKQEDIDINANQTDINENQLIIGNQTQMDDIDQDEWDQSDDTNTTDGLLRTNDTAGLLNDEQPSPKVRTRLLQSNQKSNTTTNSSNSSNATNGTKNQTQEQVHYFTRPPPQQPKPYLQRGYFEFMDHDNILIFAQNNYLIGMNLNNNQAILLSEQLEYDFLFKNETVKGNVTKENSTQDTSKGTDGKNAKDSKDSKDGKQNKDRKDNQDSKDAKDAKEANDAAKDPKPATPPSSLIPLSLLQPKPLISPQYQPLNQFQQIKKINETHFALIDRRKGIYIYQLLKKKVKNINNQFQDNYFIRLSLVIGKEEFGRIFGDNEELNLVDVEYNVNKSLLLVLDYEKGVFAFELINAYHLGNTDAKANKPNTANSEKDNTTIAPKPFTLSSNIILKKMCTIMSFAESSQTLYLACNKIYRISMTHWPKITEKTFPHPLINIRQIFIEEKKDIFILSGYSVFKIMYLDRTTNYYQDDMLDKIIFSNQLAITANQNHIIVLKYHIDRPSIICHTNNRTSLGTHHLMIRTTAECSQSYLKFINYTIKANTKILSTTNSTNTSTDQKKNNNTNKPSDQDSSKPSINEQDICVYTVYKNVYFWQQAQMPIKPLAIITLIVLIFLMVMLIWWILVKFRMQRAQARIQYLLAQGHKSLVEQEIKQSHQEIIEDNSKEKDNKMLLTAQQKNKPSDKQEQDQQPNKHLYSIE